MPIAPRTYWELLKHDDPPPKRRTTHSKTRTGCSTCKKRRVKCDEGRPICDRCAKSGHKCLGYDDARKDVSISDGDSTTSGHKGGTRERAKQGQQTSQPPVLLPKLSHESSPSFFLAAESQERRLNLVRASMTPSYLGTKDVPYFSRFQHQLLADLSTWTDGNYWLRQILYEVLYDETIQHAALAASAMLMDIEEQKTCRLSQQRKISGTAVTNQRMEDTERSLRELTINRDDRANDRAPLISLSPTTTHGKAALRHYTTALHRCRQSLLGSGITPTTARSCLTVTFLFAVFELVQGNIGEADRLCTNGVTLLYDALSRQNPDGTPFLVPDGELREIRLAFDKLSITWGLCPFFSTKAASRVLESRGAELIPHHYEVPSPDTSIHAKQLFWNAFSSSFSIFMLSVQSLPHLLSEPQIQTQRTTYLSQLHTWLPMLRNLHTTTPTSPVLAITYCTAQSYIIYLNCMLDPTELSYDAYSPLFEDILSVYESLIPHFSPQTLNPPTTSHPQPFTPSPLRITLDLETTPQIPFLLTKCRSSPIRTRFQTVFHSLTAHQAWWTNPALLSSLHAHASLEDLGRDPVTDHIPPESRFVFLRSEWAYEGRAMTAVFAPVLDRREDGEAVVRVRIGF